jgi:hypothetical protein
MAKKRVRATIIQELAELFSSRPSDRQLLDYHPSKFLQARAYELLEREKDGTSSADDKQELDEFEIAERLIRLVKSNVHTKKAVAKARLR